VEHTRRSAIEEGWLVFAGTVRRSRATDMLRIVALIAIASTPSAKPVEGGQVIRLF
jgi:hypothetical protein